LRTAACLAAALTGFAGNSLLCRAALRDGAMDPLVFTVLRLASGAAVLWLLVVARRRHDAAGPGGATPARRLPGDWPSALALLAYALLFALAYRHLAAATGALLLFGAVQLTMLGQALRAGEPLGGWRGAGMALAATGLATLLLPGWQAPPLAAGAAMLAAGVAWGANSLRGRGSADALADTAGNFLRSLPPLAVVAGLALATGRLDPAFGGAGLAAALASGALASGVGYALWYAALPRLSRGAAGSAQLAVPVLTALGGVVLLGEPLAPRVVAAAVLVLGGLGLVFRAKAGGRPPEP
jgi:drug/metabolite transporter (DMT)-like permease